MFGGRFRKQTMNFEWVLLLCSEVCVDTGRVHCCIQAILQTSEARFDAPDIPENPLLGELQGQLPLLQLCGGYHSQALLLVGTPFEGTPTWQGDEFVVKDSTAEGRRRIENGKL
eukprot:1644171-Amphidinium_carterae.1